MEQHFSLYGAVQECILMVERATGRSRCFGFVTMADSVAVERVLSEVQCIDGKRVDCKPAVPTKQGTVPQDIVGYRTKKLFVGGLPTDINEDSFRGFFDAFGDIEDSIVMYDRDTGRSRGFGFITYAHEDSVEKVLENYEHNVIGGKWVECKKATPKQAFDSFKGPHTYIPPYMMCPPFIPQFNDMQQSFEFMTSPQPEAQEFRPQCLDSDKKNLIEDLLGEDAGEARQTFDESRGKTFN